MAKCDRCKQETGVLIMSMFNTQMICPGCRDREQADPMYEQAREQELEAVRRGDYNFGGIGLPKRLR